MINSLAVIINKAKESLNEKYVSELDLKYLIQETFSLSDTQYILSQNKEYDDALFMDRWERANKGEPLYYILGKAPFYKRDFIVKEGVTLIPRNETEELVALTINLVMKKRYAVPEILDIGTGTGCIAISLAKELTYAKVSAVDISNDALEVAKQNNEIHHANVEFILGDTLDEVLDRKFDVIVSNPPYIDRDTFVSDSVLEYEPHLALFADNHGLAIYEKIFKNLDKVLKNDGISLYEISPDLEEGLKKLIDKYLKNYYYEFIKDINGFTRFLYLNK